MAHKDKENREKGNCLGDVVEANKTERKEQARSLCNASHLHAALPLHLHATAPFIRFLESAKGLEHLPTYLM